MGVSKQGNMKQDLTEAARQSCMNGMTRKITHDRMYKN